MATKFTAKPRRGAKVGKRRGGKSPAARARRGKRIGRRHAHGGGGGGKFNFLGLDLMSGVVGGVGAIGTGLLTNVVAGYVPVDQLKTGPGKLVLRAGVTAVASFAAKKALPSKFSNPLIAGALVGLGIEALQQLVMPHLPVPAMSGYESLEQQLGIIEELQPGTLNGILAVDGGLGANDGVFSMPGSINSFSAS